MRSVDTTERNSSDRAKVKGNEYTKVSKSIQEPVRIQWYLRIGVSINPLHPKISMHILHTVFHKFPKVLTRRFCFTIKSSCTC